MDIEKVARAIAKANGDDFDALPADKREWTAKQGQFGGRFRDVNEPRKPDYLDMAEAAIAALREPDLPVMALACACIGPQNGEPYCPCEMRRRREGEKNG